MICPKCNGRGTVGYYDTDHFVDVECDRCHGSGEVPMTNEEYLKSCTTEQLADVFYMVFHNHADRVLNAFWDKHKDVFKKDMMEWLKQPHTD